MELAREQILRHRDAVVAVLNEATVKSHSRRSKKGKAYTVKQYDRKINVGDTIVVKDGHPLGGSTGKVVSVKPGNGDDDWVTWRKTGGVSALGLHGDYASKLNKKSAARGNQMKVMDKIKLGQGPDPFSPGQLKKKYGKNIFSGGKKRKSYTSTGRLRNNPGSEFERPYGRGKK